MIWGGVLFALFAWWFFTGAILLAVRAADRRGGEAHAMLVAAGLPVALIGLGLVQASLQATGVAGVYQGFIGALLVWGWIELAFLAGVITGPVRERASGPAPFGQAFGTVAYHELLLVLGLFALIVLSDGAENRVALATYLVLFLARISAKLNLYLGVPRINTEFVPARLQHLKSYFRQGPITLAFPAAITVLTVMLAVCAERLWSAQADTHIAGYALLTALAALALIEHWLMVVPLPDARLWRWMLPEPVMKTTEESVTDGL